VTSAGGCLCGAVRYEARGEPFVVCLCHCGLCRRSAGATPVAWATFEAARVAVTGEPAWYRSSNVGRRGHCARCGTALFFENTLLPAEMDVTLATLDDPERFAPDRHIWTPAKVSWVHVADALPRHVGDSDSALL
jgi:hypothetical protein